WIYAHRSQRKVASSPPLPPPSTRHYLFELRLARHIPAPLNLARVMEFVGVKELSITNFLDERSPTVAVSTKSLVGGTNLPVHLRRHPLMKVPVMGPVSQGRTSMFTAPSTVEAIRSDAIKGRPRRTKRRTVQARSPRNRPRMSQWSTQNSRLKETDLRH
ncbi:hypothetical protein T265_11649, partial [Opisthorchis viverrini]